MRTHGQIALVLAASLLAAACSLDIQHGLTEAEANDIVVLLQARGIDARKEKEEGTGTGEGTYKVVAHKSEGPKAMALLKEAELPKPRVAGLELFNRGSLIPTPTEEKAMLLAALSGELAKTLRGIEGVVDARVHVVLPEEDRFRDKDRAPPEPTAGVYLKWRPTATAKGTGGLPFRLEEVKQLIAHGVPNLKEANVSVMATMATPVSGPEGGFEDMGMVSVLGMKMSTEARVLLIGILLVLVAVCAFLGFTLFRGKGAAAD